MSAVTVGVMVGETITEIHGMEVGSEAVTFRMASGRAFRLWFEPDCCASVEVNEVIGIPADLIGAPLLQAEEVSSEDFPAPPHADSYTWTFYHFASIKGYVTLRWLGESNGYYSESVSFEECAA